MIEIVERELSQESWILVLALSLISFVALDKSLNLSESYFPNFKIRSDDLSGSTQS